MYLATIRSNTIYKAFKSESEAIIHIASNYNLRTAVFHNNVIVVNNAIISFTNATTVAKIKQSLEGKVYIL